MEIAKKKTLELGFQSIEIAMKKTLKLRFGELEIRLTQLGQESLAWQNDYIQGEILSINMKKTNQINLKTIERDFLSEIFLFLNSIQMAGDRAGDSQLI